MQDLTKQEQCHSLLGQLIEAQQECFENYIVQNTTRDKFAKDWELVCVNANNTPCDYVLSTLNYHLCYLKGPSGNQTVYDLSIILYLEQTPVAIWPLNLFWASNQWKLQSHCKGIIPPLLSNKLTNKQQKKLLHQCIEFINRAQQLERIDTIECNFDPNEHITWQRLLTPLIATIQYHQTLYLDLKPQVEQLKSSFRKSYKSLINQGNKLWQVKRLTQISDEQIEEIRQFHIEVAGRKTRSRNSWIHQQAMINCGDAFAICLHNNDNKLIAAAIFNISRAIKTNNAMYSVGIYQRELFHLPLGHTVQMAAISYLKELGIDQYFLGYRHHHYEYPTPSTKESNIGFFKEGFSDTNKLEATVRLK